MKRLEVVSIDRIGLIGEITNVIRRMDGNIIKHTANVATDSSGVMISRFIADIDINEADVRSVVRRMKKIKNVRCVNITDI